MEHFEKNCYLTVVKCHPIEVLMVHHLRTITVRPSRRLWSSTKNVTSYPKGICAQIVKNVFCASLDCQNRSETLILCNEINSN